MEGKNHTIPAYVFMPRSSFTATDSIADSFQMMPGGCVGATYNSSGSQKRPLLKEEEKQCLPKQFQDWQDRVRLEGGQANKC